ncbi:mannonate dehydratase [Salibacterium qingdaonense]|uniref:Mannonate dehydratase n=1 Tax=Salibacterium qingdaonense TaxID=266892 RepID=A0A1I4N3D6_9BACI|nr:mannonate dehydratase [Salibacterium qingdaonense]SFM10019.1 D-mannonate dehydratase [Salibacterium qingdaonense]
MKMGFRWFGEDNDSISLADIRQIPNTTQIVWALHQKEAGEVWQRDEIAEEVKNITSKGFKADVVESVNVHEDIKLGLPSREQYIENYKVTLQNLAAEGVKTVCYNFMPVFDWIRTDLHKELNDGSTALFYENEQVEHATPEDIINKVLANPEFTMPGWEPSRLHHISSTIKQYEHVTEEMLQENLKYFLEKVIPTCEEYDIALAVHPDDPPWEVFQLPRIVSNYEHLETITGMVDSTYNGLTLCSGALGSSSGNDVPQMIYDFQDRIHFAHVRNVQRFDNGDFIETSHREDDGSVPVLDILKAYHDIGFQGVIRPDHGRHLWKENSRPGYGLYDRALGIMYLHGSWDTLNKH